MSYNSLEEIVRECQEKDLPFDEVILLDDMNERNVSREESIETMRGMWEAMKGAERNYDGSLQSRSGLVGAPERRCARMSRAGTRSADRLSEKLWHLHLRWVSQTPA